MVPSPPFEHPGEIDVDGFQIPADELFGPPIDDAWNTTLNNLMMEPIASEQLNLGVFKDLSADFALPKLPPEKVGGKKARETKETMEGEDASPLGAAGSRHGSNDRLEINDGSDDSPRESLKSQQTTIGVLVGTTMVQPKLRPRPTNVPARLSRPVRTKSLPKRLADTNMSTTLPTHTSKTQAVYHDQVSSSMDISAQSDNSPAGQMSAGTVAGRVESGSFGKITKVGTIGAAEKKRKSAHGYGYGHAQTQTMTSMVVSSRPTGRSESRGKPSFADLVASGVMEPGTHVFQVGSHSHVIAEVHDDGAIMYGGTLYRAVSKFALQVLRLRNPSRQSCDGWKEVSWNGDKLDKVRVEAADRLRAARLQQ